MMGRLANQLLRFVVDHEISRDKVPVLGYSSSAGPFFLLPRVGIVLHLGSGRNYLLAR